MAAEDWNGCEWPIDSGCFDESWAALSAEVQERATMLASATLRRLTGYRVGGCPVTVRPCKQSRCGFDFAYLPAYAGPYRSFNPHINIDGYWVNSCGCENDCSCTTVCEVALPDPVGQIVEVKVNGAIVPESDYRLDRNRLVWVGAGECPWPACQDITKADTEDNTFSVTYLNSYPVDGMGAYAAGVLAMEFAKACGGGKCRLPPGVTTVTRQGVSWEVATGSFPDGFTGIREVDVFISLWNPGALRQRPQVWSPDLRNHPRVVN